MPLRILIIGASVAGPTLATLLLSSSLPNDQKPHVTLLERSPALRPHGQNIDIRGAGITIIRKLGLEHIIRASTTGEEGVQWVDSKNNVLAAFATDKSGKTQGPTSDIEILRGRLAEILVRRSQTASEEVVEGGGRGIEYLFGELVERFEQTGDGVDVWFGKSGEKRRYDIVVGADGLQSSTRRMVWGEEGEIERVKRLGMYGGFFSMPVGPTDSKWRRWYHAPGRRGVMVRPDDQRERTTVFMTVINEKDERLAHVASRRDDVKAQKQLLSEYFVDAGWESERVVREMWKTSDFYYDMIAQVKMQRWGKGRVVLLGDAGYCASPISGMGTTLALSGAYNLAGAILDHPNDPQAAFDMYEKEMRPVVDRAQKLVPGAPHIMSPETAWGLWIMEVIITFISWTRVASIIFMFAGPPATAVPIRDYGFQQLTELRQ